MKLSPFALVLSAGALVAASTLVAAQIERLDLKQMVSKADDAVFGTITRSQVVRVDSPNNGPEHYFTTLTIAGRSLKGDGRDLTVDVTFAGGFIDAENGVHNSEAPAADDAKVGNRVVAFYKWTDNMGGGFAANALYAAHGGLYRTIEARKGTVVLGRGDGYAVPQNITLSELDSQIP